MLRAPSVSWPLSFAVPQALSSTPSAGQLVRDKTGSLAKEFLTPTVKLEFRKPTLGVWVCGDGGCFRLHYTDGGGPR